MPAPRRIARRDLAIFSGLCGLSGQGLTCLPGVLRGVWTPCSEETNLREANTGTRRHVSGERASRVCLVSPGRGGRYPTSPTLG